LNGTNRSSRPSQVPAPIRALKVHIVKVDADELAEPRPERRTVPDRRSRRPSGVGSTPRRGARASAFPKRCAAWDVLFSGSHHRARIVVDQILSAQVPEKRARRCELPRGGRARQPLLVEIAEKTPEGVSIEMFGLHLAALDAGGRRRVRDELRQIALVGAHGVAPTALRLSAEKLQECF